MDNQHLSYRGKILKPYITKEKIQESVCRIAKKISSDYEGKNLLILGILNGAFMFISDLVRQLTITDVEVDFVKLSSYQGTSSTNVVQELIGLKGEITGRSVLIVDDILETGQTLMKLINTVQTLGATDVKTCVLAHKVGKLVTDAKADYIGFEIEDKFIIGYGMDWNEKFRGLPEIYIAENE